MGIERGIQQVSKTRPGRSGIGMNQGPGEIHDTGRERETVRLRPRQERGCLCSTIPGGLGRYCLSHDSLLSTYRAGPGTVQHQVLLKEGELFS